jgi:hypothetical protein
MISIALCLRKLSRVGEPVGWMKLDRFIEVNLTVGAEKILNVNNSFESFK